MRQDRLDEAVAYLRSRNKYIVDSGCKFVPTKAVQTDVAETIRRYRQEVDQVPSVQLVKGKKK